MPKPNKERAVLGVTNSTITTSNIEGNLVKHLLTTNIVPGVVDTINITTNNISCRFEMNCTVNVSVAMRLLESTHSDLADGSVYVKATAKMGSIWSWKDQVAVKPQLPYAIKPRLILQISKVGERWVFEILFYLQIF